MARWSCVAGLVGLVLGGGGEVTAQFNGGTNWAPVDATRAVRGCCDNLGPPTLDAVRVAEGEIDIDGLVIEGPWLRAPVATTFVQFEPGDGIPATERTEARVLYGDNALYVAMRAYDSEPDQIAGQLTRRDQDSYSDLLAVVIDSYFDRRTAFQFAVNPVGVKHDVYRFDDTQEDSGWDAVWNVATSVDDEGWTAEFRIPYSQLRFRNVPEQTWGINFMRSIARRDETDVWAPTTRQDAAIVSRFGELRGLKELNSPNHLTVAPYTVARLERAPGEAANPFYSENQAFATVGADAKYGVTSDLTLDLTINPDFGQVEADPAQVNLTANETFLPERRPFFVEGSSIFNFGIALGDGDGAGESLFYSRRIGRAPQGSADVDDGYVDVSAQTTILGAWKLSGKTAGGWSIGGLQALTAQETARIAPSGGSQYEQPVEPLSNYAVARVQKDFREGRSALGVIGTAVNRDREVANDLGLRTAAYTGGLDFRHRFAGERYQVSGYLLGSHIMGSEEAIATAQKSPVRYYQRPDAKSFSFDPTRTSLSGGSAFFSIAKIGGGHWRFSTGLHTRSPGFEANDIGYQRDADSFVNWGWVQYRQDSPQGPFRRWSVNLNGFTAWNYDRDNTGLGGNVNGSFQLQNFWTGYAGVNLDASAYSGRTLRGGPLFKREGSINFWSGVGADSRKAVSGDLNLWGNVRRASDSWNLGLSPGIRFRPSGRATFRMGATLHRNVDDYQWVQDITKDDTHYVFGRIDQNTVGLSLRADYAFTPTLSLQLYAEPFVSAGAYAAYKQVADPVADRYEGRFTGLATRIEGETVYADVDGDGVEESFDQPDFNFKQFRSNAVLRWEYRPGSALFVVWSQGRNHYIQNGDFSFRGDVRDLFGVSPDNVFMVKFSYWMSR